MIELLMTFLLIMVLNIPVYLELYKHSLKHKGILVQIIMTAAYWAAAVKTQNLAAFAAVIFLYVFFYRNSEENEPLRDIDVWHINIGSIIAIIVLSLGARILIGIVNYAYVVVLDQIMHYDIKAQDIVAYYTQAEWWIRDFLVVEIILIAPIVEEFVFRFFLYDRFLSERMPRYIAALLSAGLFTLVHFNVAGIPTFFGLGLLCVLMYEKRGYWGAVIAHGVCNAITLFFL